MKIPKMCGKAAFGLGMLLLGGSISLAQRQQMPSASQTPGQGGSQQKPGMDSQMAGMQDAAGQPASIDRMFLKDALQGSMAEVQLGQLTLKKSDNQQVKEFAQRMIDDHTKMSEQMKPVAQQLGVEASKDISKKDKSVMSKLEAFSGTAYDQAYIKDMVKDHKQDLSEFQTEASSGQDPRVKDAATQGSQIIAQHLQMAQQMAKDQNVDLAKK